MRSVSRLTVSGVLIAMVVGGCGSTSTTGHTAGSNSSSTPSPPSARELLLTAAKKASETSVRVDASVAVQFGGTGSVAQQFSASSATISFHLDLQSATAMSGSMSATVNGRSLTIPLTVVNGTVYVSSDGGATYKTAPAGSSTTDNLNASLEYLQSVGSVTDTGTASLNGASVHTYHAVFDPTTATAYLRGKLASSSTNANVVKLFQSLSITGGAIDVSIDANGHLAQENGEIDASMNSAAFASSQTGTVTFAEKFNATFSDYGAHIVVTPPPGA